MRGAIASHILGVAQGEGARPDAECRRLVRHEGAGLSRICRAPPCREGARPAGEVDRPALRELRVRPPRPRPCARGRARARQGRPLPRRARRGLRRSRRLSLPGDAAAVLGQRREEPARRVRDAGDRRARSNASSPTRRRSAPIAAPGAPRATTSWSGSSRPPPPRPASIASSSAAATTSRPTRCPTGRRPTTPTIRASSRRSSSAPLAAADWAGFADRRAESRARGRLRGIGIGQYLEVTAPPMNEMGGIRFEADGTVTIITGTLDYGQGHATPFAQVLSRAARHPVRAHPAAAGRFRRAHRRRRHRRLEVDHGERRRDREGWRRA